VLLHLLDKILESLHWPRHYGEWLLHGQWRAGKRITTRQLAKLLEPFKIAPAPTRFGTLVSKGYRLDQFRDAFLRYLPEKSVTPSQTAEIGNPSWPGRVRA
jgi:hypothetical protein